MDVDHNRGERDSRAHAASLAQVLLEWGRIGCVGFGGPPTHIALLRKVCVDNRRWLAHDDFEDALAACNLLPGPASTQLAIYCAFRVRGRIGAVAGGVAFIVPGLILILALAALFLGSAPPRWLQGAGLGAGAAVPAVAVDAGASLLPASLRRSAARASARRWLVYVVAGAVASWFTGPWLVLVLVGIGLYELAAQHPARHSAAGVPLSLVWVAFKVGALSYGGGFVIVPLMRGDAVDTYDWMSGDAFLNAVALGQVTPGPVVHTVAAVGYAAAGVAGGLVAALVAFAPSFAFILLGGRRFDAIRASARARAFLDGAGPAAVGAIIGSSVPLAATLSETWEFGVLAGAAALLLALRRGVVVTLLAAGAAGAIAVLAGAQT